MSVEVVATSNAPAALTLPPPPIVIVLPAVVTAANIFLASSASATISPPTVTLPVSVDVEDALNVVKLPAPPDNKTVPVASGNVIVLLVDCGSVIFNLVVGAPLVVPANIIDAAEGVNPVMAA